MINIQKAEAEVYPQELYGEGKKYRKPNVGEELNKPSIIQLHNCVLNKKKDPKKHLKRLKQKAKENGYELLKYDHITGDYIIKVPHYTKYTIDIEEDEESEDSIQIEID